MDENEAKLKLIHPTRMRGAAQNNLQVTQEQIMQCKVKSNRGKR